MKYDPAGRVIEQQLGAIAHAHASEKDRHFYPSQYRPDVQVGMVAAIQRRYRYDPSGQLTGLDDSRRGRIEYRYDPIGRLLAANSPLGHETFAFDPAGNIQAPATAEQEHIPRRAPLPRLLDNLLKEYAGVNYRYDERGNLVERVQNGERSAYEWDAFNRMTRATTWHGVTTFVYDPLGRRIAKHSQAMEGNALKETTRTMYGWDGDTLALESSVHEGHAAGERTVHYVYERDSFVPLVQATRSRALQLARTTDVKALMAGNDGKYDIALDPLWNGELDQEPEPFGKDEVAFYQCDHLGTPQELTNCEGKVAWAAQYKAWGQAKEAISDAACKAGIRNPIRFQGQHFDDETGLHYNRHRYYDSHAGRFVSKDPIGLGGGFNTHSYAANPTAWVDPLGLKAKTASCGQSKGGRFSSADGAANAALLRYNDKSIRDNLEYGGLIYQTPDGKFDYTKAIRGTKDGVDPWDNIAPKVPKCAREAGYWHTHGDHSDKRGNRTTKSKDYYDSNNFSDGADGSGDLPIARQSLSTHPDYRAYVGTPSAGNKGFRAATNQVYKL